MQSLHCPLLRILRKLRTQQRVCSLSHCLQLLLIRHGSSCVLRSTSFIRSSLRSIPPHSQLNHLLQGMACTGCHTELVEVQSHAFSQANATILTGFHSASFVATSFQSCSVHPLPIIWLAGRPTSAALSLRMLIAHVVPPFRKASLSFACIVQPPPYKMKVTPAASYGAGIGLLRRPLLTSPSWGARRHFRSFLPPVPFGGSPPRLQCGQVCRTAWLLFSRRRFYRLYDRFNVSTAFTMAVVVSWKTKS